MGTGSWPRWWALYNGKRQKKKKKKKANLKEIPPTRDTQREAK